MGYVENQAYHLTYASTLDGLWDRGLVPVRLLGYFSPAHDGLGRGKAGLGHADRR